MFSFLIVSIVFSLLILFIEYFIKIVIIFEKLKKENIHTCVDTSGMVALTPDIKKLLS